MVMNISLADVTWNQLLRVLLHITRVMFHLVSNEEYEIRRYQSVAGRLACNVFQVTANVFDLHFRSLNKRGLYAKSIRFKGLVLGFIFWFTIFGQVTEFRRNFLIIS